MEDPLVTEEATTQKMAGADASPSGSWQST